jgi:hypothetical protein
MNRLREHQRFILLGVCFFWIVCFPGTGFSEFRLDLQWEPAREQDLAGYRLFLREEGRPYDYDWPEWQGETPMCSVANLDENAVYYFVIRAFDSYGVESPDSNEVRVTYADLFQ